MKTIADVINSLTVEMMDMQTEKMTLEEAIAIIKSHHEWRSGADTKMLDPQEISEAMYLVIAAAECWENMEE